jgi:hypothetical protein
MDRFEAGWEHDAELGAARGPGPDPHAGPSRPLERLAAVPDGRGDWPEAVWSAPESGVLEQGTVLFSDPFAEAELRREMRLSELWERCRNESCTLDEFFELSTLITEVEPIENLLCVDCATLGRPLAPAHWSMGATDRCRAHLRFHLGHARIDGEGGPPRP